MPDFFSARAEAIERHGVKMLAVRAYLNRKGPYRLLVDTGADVIVVPSDLASELGLRDPHPTSAGVIGRETPILANAYWLDAFGVEGEDGSVFLTEEPLEVLPTVLAAYEEEIYHGMVGMNWLTLIPQVCLGVDPPTFELHLRAGAL